MQVRKIRDLVNARLAGEQLTYSQLVPYLDLIIDDINQELNAEFLVFSDIPVEQHVEFDYKEFPDKYIRTVLVVGVAWKWYVDDEEGIETAQALQQEYVQNKFIMQRDYGPIVPLDKRADASDRGGPGYLNMGGCEPQNDNTWNPDIRLIEKAGFKGDSVTHLEIKTIENARRLYATITTQDRGSYVVDCGVVSPLYTDFRFDSATGDLLVVTNEPQKQVHRVGNFMELFNKGWQTYNPIVNLVYSGVDLIAQYFDGSSAVLTTLGTRIHVTQSGEAPAYPEEWDVWLEVSDIE